ncbi:MAG: hypothetical protein ACXACY_28145, partial [Candidatus Hodarchaeales archaeon]
MKKKLLLGLYICIAIILLANIIGKGWIVYHERTFEGKVIDAETKEPIEGAVVKAIYNIEFYFITVSGTHSVDAEEVLTNKDGTFYVSPNIFLYLYPFAHKTDTEFTIYKQGYESFEQGQLISRKGTLSIAAISPSTIGYLEQDTKTINGKVFEVGTKKTKTYPEGLIYAGKGCRERIDTIKQSMPLAWIEYIFFPLEGAQKKIRSL